ncbi:DUF1573 domain-containing protein [bacterium]|nr:DUF1573 domain-containing protein [candidate division CSSED10-310 bacterium]
MLVTTSDVPPGGEGTIDVTFDTRNRSGKSRKSITVHTNDPANRRIKLMVSAELEELLAPSPKRLWFDRITDRHPVTRTCSLDGSRLDTVSIKSIHLNSPVPDGAYTWTLNDARPSGQRSITLDVTLHPDKIIPGKFNHTLLIETDLETAGTLEVRLNGEIAGTLSTEPARVLFANFVPGQSLEETVVVQTCMGMPFVIREATSDDTEVTVDIESSHPAAAHKIHIQFNPVLDRERLFARIKISTDLADQAELYLDINGFRKRIPKEITPRAVY